MSLVNWAHARTWRDETLADLAVKLFPDVAVHAPSPDQWEMDLGDTLPLQARAARTERSEGARPSSAACLGRS